jgi:uncharacterized protein
MRALIASVFGRSARLGLLLLPLLVFADAVLAQTAHDFPPLTGRVVDEAGLLSPAERESLTQALTQHEQSTGQQVVVVTLNSLRERPIEDYGYQLGRHWGIGAKDRNTGALFIIAPRERKVRIEVGYGLEGTLTDAASRLIIENIVLPAFRSGQFGPGIVAGTGAILKTLAGDEAAIAPPSPKQQRPMSEDGIVPLIVLFIVILFVLSAMARYRRPSPGGLHGHRRRGWQSGGFIGGLGGLGGGFGGGGGGGFSGGGGSFGGGGASGDW